MTKQITDYTGAVVTRGRAHGLTEEFIEEVIRYRRQGLPWGDSCRLAGRTDSTVSRWLKGVAELGHEDPQDCIDNPVYLTGVSQDDYCTRFCALYRASQKALAAWKLEKLEKINRDPSWQSQMALLERIDPANFAKTERVQVEKVGADPLGAQVTEDQRRAMVLGAAATIGAAAVVAQLMRGNASTQELESLTQATNPSEEAQKDRGPQTEAPGVEEAEIVG